MARPGRPYNRIQLPPHRSGLYRNSDLIKLMRRQDRMLARTLETAFEDVTFCMLPSLLFSPLALSYPLLTIASANPPVTSEYPYNPCRWRVLPLIVAGFTV
jgi:hypothetical protein